MMLSLDPISRDYEISGLSPQEVKMYDLAWQHNKDGLGFAGLCNLWFMNISQHITLNQVWHVWQRLNEFSFFRTDAYWMLYNEGKERNDYVPHI